MAQHQGPCVNLGYTVKTVRISNTWSNTEFYTTNQPTNQPDNQPKWNSHYTAKIVETSHVAAFIETDETPQATYFRLCTLRTWPPTYEQCKVLQRPLRGGEHQDVTDEVTVDSDNFVWKISCGLISIGRSRIHFQRLLLFSFDGLLQQLELNII